MKDDVKGRAINSPLKNTSGLFQFVLKENNSLLIEEIYEFLRNIFNCAIYYILTIIIAL